MVARDTGETMPGDIQETGEVRSVKDFKDFVLEKAGVTNHFEFVDLSLDHKMFWQKLNRIYKEKGISSKDADDVDALTRLHDNEWRELKEELGKLQGSNSQSRN